MGCGEKREKNEAFKRLDTDWLKVRKIHSRKYKEKKEKAKKGKNHGLG